MGVEPGEAARATLVAMALAETVGVDAPADVYYTTLLQHVGCTAYAHEAAALAGGDEIALKRIALDADTAAAHPRTMVEGYSRANCEVAARTAERLGLGAGVAAGLTDVYEQWDGAGGPRGLRGEAIALPARIAQVASVAALHGVATVRRRAGGALDPALAERLTETMLRHADDPPAAVVEAEPEPFAGVSEPGLDAVCRAFGEAVDLKTPLHHGHSTGVADLAAAAGERLGLGVADLRRAALLHDIGRAAIPNGVWERPGPLGWADQERVRLHAYHSERVLARCGPLAPLAPLAGMHHERLDGSGYHRQVAAAAIGLPARVLAAADAFQAMTQPRAHRPARSGEQAAEILAGEVKAGRLDADAARAVIAAAGERPRPLRRDTGLTERQIEVLRLVARGLSNRAIAETLVVSPRTAEHHVQDIYARIGVSSRAAAALFAMEHDLLGGDW
jgi:HD-GYP domain-containing protein (c-di-GMP phosphodiesterase class II)